MGYQNQTERTGAKRITVRTLAMLLAVLTVFGGVFGLFAQPASAQEERDARSTWEIIELIDLEETASTKCSCLTAQRTISGSTT